MVTLLGALASASPQTTIRRGADWDEVCGTDGRCTRTMYAGAVNMPDETGVYKPFTEVVNLSWDSGAFKLSWYDGYIKMEPFVVYNSVEYTIPQIKSYYPNINLKNYINKLTGKYKYALNLSNIPDSIKSNVDYIGLRVIEAQNITFADVVKHDGCLYIKSKVKLCYQDLLDSGFTLTMPDSKTVLIGNVSNKNTLWLDPTAEYNFSVQTSIWAEESDSADDNCEGTPTTTYRTCSPYLDITGSSGLDYDDGSYELTSGTAYDDSYDLFIANVQEDVNSIISLNWTWNGHAGTSTIDLYGYIWNNSAGSWFNCISLFQSDSDVTKNCVITNGISDFLDNGNVSFLVYGDFPLSTALYNDFVSLEVTYIPNSAPNVTTPLISLSVAYTNTDLTANTTYSDSDGDKGNITFKWYKNNVNIHNQTFTNQINGTVLNSTLGSGNFSKNDIINVSVQATDNNSANSSVFWSAQLTISNSAPTWAETISMVSLTHNNDLDIQFNATDLDGDSLTWADNTSLFDINASGYVFDNPTQAETGTYHIQINVSDGTDIITMNFTYQINNSPPSFVEAPPNVSIYHDQSFNIQLNATDNEGDNINWGLDSSLAVINQSGYLTNGTISYSDHGNITINVTINDSLDNTTKSFQLEVKTYPPVVNSANISANSIYVGATLNITANISDIDDNISVVTYYILKANLQTVSGTMTDSNGDGVYEATRTDTAELGTYYLKNIVVNDSLNNIKNQSYGTSKYVTLASDPSKYEGGGGGGGGGGTELVMVGNVTYNITNVTFSITPKPPIDRYFVIVSFSKPILTYRYSVNANRVLAKCEISNPDSRCIIYNKTWVGLEMDFSRTNGTHVKTSWVKLYDMDQNTFDFQFTVRPIYLGAIPSSIWRWSYENYIKTKPITIPDQAKNLFIFVRDAQERVIGVRYVVLVAPLIAGLGLIMMRTLWFKYILGVKINS